MNSQGNIKSFRMQYVVAVRCVLYTRRMEHPRLPDRSRRVEGAEKKESWHVAEAFSEARDSVRGSEDAYLVSDHCIAVFDGVSRNGTKYDGVTPGQFAVQTVRDAFEKNSLLRADDAAHFATETLRTAAAQRKIEQAALVFVAFFPKENRIVRVGDCSFLIDGTGHNPGITPDRAKAELRRRIVERALENGLTEDEVFADDPARGRMSELRVWQETYANNPDAPDFGYGVVNGDDIPEQYVEHISVPEGAQAIVLATDGYPTQALRNSLEESERELKAVERIDPLGIGETKSVRMNMPRRDQAAADDRTYIKIVP